jgi:hypothetical protein
LTESGIINEAIADYEEMIVKEVLSDKMVLEKAEVEGSEDFSVDGEGIWVGVRRVSGNL